MMRVPRFRIRTLMIAVAAVAVFVAFGVTLHRRSTRFRQLADFHVRAASRIEEELAVQSVGQVNAAATLDVVHWHDSLYFKYTRAANRPWLPVAADPPEPN
jgi:hypothetical protein